MALQYQGSVTISGVKVPVTGCTLDKSLNPAEPDLIWGGGYKINYAKGQQKYGGNVAFPLFANFISTLKTIVEVGNGTNKRDTFFSTIFDDSINQNTYGSCKVGSCTLSSDGSGVITCGLDLVAKGRTISAHAAGSGFTASTVATALKTPIPYWNSQFTAFGIPSNQITAWSITLNNNPFILYTHDNTSDPNDIQLGLQIVEASFTYYTSSTAAQGFGFATGSSAPTPTFESGALDVAANADASCGSLTLDGTAVWTFGQGVLKSAMRSVDSPNNKPMRKVTFSILGTTSLAPLS